MVNYKDLNKKEKDVIINNVKVLKRDWYSLRKISAYIQEENWVNISFWAVRDIIAQMEVEDFDSDVEDKEIEHNEENLYVYTSKINKFWEKETIRHEIPFLLLNKIQQAYSKKWKDWSQQTILDNNWWTTESPIYLKSEVWNVLKKALWLNKLSWLANEIYLKILYDKFGKQEVEWYIDWLAHDTTRERFRELERRSIERAVEKQYEDVIRRWAKLEEYLERITEIVPKIELPSTRFKSYIRNNDWILYVLFWDMHVGRTTEELEANVDKMISYILSTWYTKVEFINVWDNLESPMLQWMHVSQVLEMDYRWFDQITKATSILEKIMLCLYEQQVECNMFWIVGNHWRWTVNTNDDPQRLPELALYEIVKSRLWWFVSYTKEAITTQTIWEFNFIISHWDYWFANKSPDQIMWIKSINNGKYTIIVNWHMHNPRIEQWPRYTRIQTPSMNVPDRYATDIVLKECLPWFVTVESLNWFPQITFIPCV